MASLSTNLLLSLFAEGDSTGNGFTNWGDSANSNFEFLEDAITELSSITVTTVNVTLTSTEARSIYIKTTGVLTGNRDVILPARKHFFFAYNGNTGAFTTTFKVSGQTGIAVTQGRWAFLYCDGTDVTRLFTDLDLLLTNAYQKSNVLGTVSQSAGVPTGPVIEHSEGTPNGDGDYIDLVRLADGTQVLKGRTTLIRASTTRMEQQITFPKNFVDADYSVTSNFRPENNADAPASYVANCALSARELLAPVHGSKSIGSVTFNVFGISGAGTFAVNDELYLDYTITGRWF